VTNTSNLSVASSQIQHFEQRTPQLGIESPIQSGFGSLKPIVQITPADLVKRLGTGWQGWYTESIHAPAGSRMLYRFQGPMHLLVIYNEGTRSESEASVEGLPLSKIKNTANKLTFVPAGCNYREWLETAASTRVTFLYLEPATLKNDGDISYAAKVHLEDPVVWETATRLKSAIENGQTKRTVYLAALSSVLGLELSRPVLDAVREPSIIRGGLASWQKRVILGYIEEHLDEQICLAKLAGMARLSQHHFCRAFKHAFGIPPHQYHVQRRIERAKILLADPEESISEIALALGYSQISSFSVAFRKITGWSPSEYRREFK
jgi:AraC family transcriptional regulator